MRQFFEVRVPDLLARNRELARGITGRCLFDVDDAASGRSKWVLDFTTDPPMVLAGDVAETDCQISLAADNFLELIDDPSAGQVLAWQGKLRVAGDQALMSRMAQLLFPPSSERDGVSAGYYASLSRLIPDPRLTFMNYGYAEDGDDGNFGWLSDADRPWRFAINLIRRTLDGTQIRGARVLDIGCGRGGPASYIARCLDPLQVTGLDACSDGIRFCKSRHRHPNLKFVYGQAENMPLDDASFDVALNVESSHCYLNPRSFLSEVARILKPGGTFCYSDIFRPEQLGRTQLLLSEMPELRVVRVADITPQAARAIELNRESFAELLVSATDSTLRNASIIANLVRTVNVDMYERFVGGHVLYYAWRMEKVTQ